MTSPKLGIVSCAALLLAACGQPPPPPLADSAPWQAAQKTQQFEQAAKSMSRAQAEDIEHHLTEVPDDVVGRTRLLLFYAEQGTRFYDPPVVVAARRKHILWMIEHHPEAPVLGERAGLINPPIDQIADPQGYAQARKEWLAVADKPDAPLPVVGNAAAFLSDSDKPLAEKLLMAAQARDPQGPWAARLGALYADVLAGTDADYSAHVKEALSRVIDPVLVAGAHRQKPAEGSLEALSAQAIASLDQGDAAGYDDARKKAQEVLKQAPSHKGDAGAATAAYQAHIVLGFLAMRDHDRKAALRYLEDGANAPVTEQLAYTEQPVTWRFLAWLLKDGERDSVVRFLERFAKTSVVSRPQLLESAALIRKGQKPAWYPADAQP